jgi:hypothetical protein
MKKLAIVLALFALVVGSAFAADPPPRGLEAPISFADATTPYKIRIGVREVSGDWVPATYLELSASDSLRVVCKYPDTADNFYEPGDWPIGDCDTEVNHVLRYTPGGASLKVTGQLQEVWLYGPGDGSYPNSVTVNMFVEY